MYNNNKVHINIIFIIMMIAGIFTVDYTRLPDFLDYWWQLRTHGCARTTRWQFVLEFKDTVYV